MRRFALALVLASCDALAPAAPVPAPKLAEKELLAKHWGAFEGLGKFEVKDKELRLTSEKRAAVFAQVHRSLNTPRAQRTRTGKFEATLGVVDAAPPNKDEERGGFWPATRAGLFVAGNGYEIDLYLFQYHRVVEGIVEAKLTREVWLTAWHPKGGMSERVGPVELGKTVYLKLTRDGPAVRVAHSSDGTKWSEPHVLNVPNAVIDLSDEVMVGAFFLPTTREELSAAFGPLTIEPLKAEPKK